MELRSLSPVFGGHGGIVDDEARVTSFEDCDLCVLLSDNERVDLGYQELPGSGPPPVDPPPPLPATWAHLATTAVLTDAYTGWGDRWEIRTCGLCGTQYEYRQVHEDRDVLRPESTLWTLRRLDPEGAKRLIDTYR